MLEAMPEPALANQAAQFFTARQDGQADLRPICDPERVTNQPSLPRSGIFRTWHPPPSIPRQWVQTDPPLFCFDTLTGCDLGGGGGLA